MMSSEKETHLADIKPESSCENSPVGETHKAKKTCKAFKDIKFYFSEEEWEKLTDWQKSCYVYMKRNYNRMKDLGVTVNKPLFMRCKEQDKESQVKCTDAHGTNSEDDIPANVWSHRLRKRKTQVIYEEISDLEEDNDGVDN